MKPEEVIMVQGYRVTVALDEWPENPFATWPLLPPLVGYIGTASHQLGIETYGGAPNSIRDIARLLPEAMFDPIPLQCLVNEFLDLSAEEFAKYMADDEPIDEREGFSVLAVEAIGNRPTKWSHAVQWFNRASSLLERGGIASRVAHIAMPGHAGAICMAVALPEWAERAGCAPAHESDALLAEGVELYEHWILGNVFEVESITSPEGIELADGASWGYYGINHERSGLLGHARGIIEYHKTNLAQIALNEPACLI